MPEPRPVRRYRFGAFEADTATGELRRRGLRVRLHTQPTQILFLLLEHPGEVLTREEICRQLWSDGTFVDYEHSVNSAINRLRDALGDKASSPRFIETLARRGYRFIAPVEEIADEHRAVADPQQAAAESPLGSGLLDRVLATPEDLPRSPRRLVEALFLALQAMYLGFYIGTLANLGEIRELIAPLPHAAMLFTLLVATAAVLIPVRTFLFCAVLFHAPGMRGKFLRLWPLLLAADILWAMSPFLLLHHIPYGLALAAMALLVYAPFAQRSLVLMGAGD